MPDLLTMPAQEALREVERLTKLRRKISNRNVQATVPPDEHAVAAYLPALIRVDSALLALAREALLARAEKEKTR